MVANTTYKHCLAACVIDELPNIGVKSFQMFFFDIRTGGFDMKDDVEVDFTERLGHGEAF